MQSSCIRFAFVGFRHPHIFDLLAGVRERQDCRLVACCEEDAQTREILQAENKVPITHESLDRMLDEVEFDALAIGDVYAKRGELVLRALKKSKHVISDKPLCIRAEELHAIRELCRRNSLRLGLQLDLRSFSVYAQMRNVVREGGIGEVRSLSFLGQHALNVAGRPSWYFQDGLHGGTINDIAIHAIDAIEWITQQHVVRTVGARAWNAHCSLNRNFQDGAQVIFELANGAGAMGDISYHIPDSCRVTLPQSWRFTICGSEGMMEGSWGDKEILLLAAGEDKPKRVTTPPDTFRTYLDHFLRELQGRSEEGMITTESILNCTDTCLRAQRLADQNAISNISTSGKQ